MASCNKYVEENNFLFVKYLEDHLKTTYYVVFRIHLIYTRMPKHMCVFACKLKCEFRRCVWLFIWLFHKFNKALNHQMWTKVCRVAFVFVAEALQSEFRYRTHVGGVDLWDKRRLHKYTYILDIVTYFNFLLSVLFLCGFFLKVHQGVF